MNSWEQFCNGFKDFINQPLVEIIATIVVTTLMALLVMANTSIGKKLLNSLKAKVEKGTSELSKAKEDLDKAREEFAEYKANKEKEFDEQKSYYETRYGAYQNEYAKLEKAFIGLCECSNNKNVKELLNTYLANKVDIEHLETSELIENAKEQVKNEYEERYNSLSLEVAELKNIISNLTKESGEHEEE